jgi:hypothetical protein
MSDIHVAILLPTKGRAHQAASRIGDLLAPDTPDGVTLSVFVAIDTDDKKTLSAIKNLAKEHDEIQIVKRQPDTTAVQGWNAAYARACELGADWVVLGADDVEFKRGWLDAALKAATDDAQVVGLNDGHTDMPNYGAHYMATVAFMEENAGGVMAPPMYTSWWFDREICEKAHALGLYAYTPEAVIEHHHPDWGLAEMDETYEEAWPSHAIDARIYRRRRAAGYPVNYGRAA